MSEIIKILFVTQITDLYGANRSMIQLITELKELYHCQITVLGPSCQKNAIIKEKLSHIGVEYIDAPIQSFIMPKPHSWHGFIDHLRYLRAFRMFYKKLQFSDFDLVHSNSSTIDCGAWLSKHFRCKHIWHFREFGDLDYDLYPFGGRLYEKFVYHFGDAFIMISKAVANHFHDIIPKSKTHLIYNGIECVDDVNQSTHNNGKIQFICAGIVCEAKNQKEIIEAANILVNRYGIHNFHITIVGGGSLSYLSLLESSIWQYALSDYITILPQVDGIQQLASQMDVGIMCSKAEAFGRVTVEYMLQNLLVIANDAGANTEIIEHGVDGLIYHSGDFEQLADRMLTAISDHGLLVTLASKGCEKANSRFLSTLNTKKIYELYKSVLGKA